MKENWHNKELQDGLGAYDSPMDLDKAWEALETKRKPKKEKRRFFFLWFFGLLALISIGSYSILKNNAKEVDTLSIVNERLNEVAQNISETKVLEKENADLSKKEKTIAEEEVKKVESKGQLKSIETKTETNDTAIDKVELTEKGEGSILEILNNNKFTNERERLVFENNKERNTRSSQIKSTISKDSKRLSQKTIAQDNPENRFSKKAISLNSRLELPNVLKGVPLPSLQFTFSGFDLQEKESKMIVKDRPNSKKNLRTRFGLSSTYAIFTDGFIQSGEQPLDAMMYRVFYERFISPKFYLKTGFSFQQFTTELTMTEIDTDLEMENNLLLIENQFQDGSITQEYGTGEVRYVQSNNHQFFNRYRLVSIPLLVGYEFPVFSKSSLQFEVGVATSILSAHSGKIIENETHLSFDESSNFEERSIGVLQGISAVQYQVEVGQRLFLFLGAQANFHMNKSVKLEEERGQLFRSFGLSLGGKVSL